MSEPHPTKHPYMNLGGLWASWKSTWNTWGQVCVCVFTVPPPTKPDLSGSRGFLPLSYIVCSSNLLSGNVTELTDEHSINHTGERHKGCERHLFYSGARCPDVTPSTYLLTGCILEGWSPLSWAQQEWLLPCDWMLKQAVVWSQAHHSRCHQ